MTAAAEGTLVVAAAPAAGANGLPKWDFQKS
jgi:hypothetical protein